MDEEAPGPALQRFNERHFRKTGTQRRTLHRDPGESSYDDLVQAVTEKEQDQNPFEQTEKIYLLHNTQAENSGAAI